MLSGRRLAPDPPRRIPGRRALSVSLRTAHLTTFGILLGGHVFDVDAARLEVFLHATLASGVGLVALELAATFAWLRTVTGVVVGVKLALLLAIPLVREHRVALLVAVVVLSSVVAHMPARHRHARVL